MGEKHFVPLSAKVQGIDRNRIDLQCKDPRPAQKSFEDGFILKGLMADAADLGLWFQNTLFWTVSGSVAAGATLAMSLCIERINRDVI